MIDELDERRKTAKVSQKDLCARAGVNVMTYSQIKLGRRGAQVRTIDKLATALEQILKEKNVG